MRDETLALDAAATKAVAVPIHQTAACQFDSADLDQALTAVWGNLRQVAR